jgi:hypothetical protein
MIEEGGNKVNHPSVNLKDIPTRDLLEELKKREGVQTVEVDPYDEYAVEVELDVDIRGNGPAVICIVTD